MTEPMLLFREIAGSIGEITLNRPTALNALTHEMCIDLNQQLSLWEKNAAIKAVIIRAVPGRAFCAGGDVRRVCEQPSATGIAAGQQFFFDEYQLNRHIFHYSKPYIALLNGITMGGGAGISIHGSHRIATEHFLFAMPETGIGFFPDIGSSYFLTRSPGKIGTYLALTGNRIQTADAMYAGFVNHYIPSTQLDNVVDALAATAFTTDAHSSVNTLLQKFTQPIAPAPLAQHRAAIDRCFSATSIEDIFSALRTENSEWSLATLNTLASKSPTSLKVTLREMLAAAHLKFDHCIQSEYRLACRFLTSHDFPEGVRAALIDKTQDPHWQPAQLDEVTESMIADFFQPLPQGKELSFE